MHSHLNFSAWDPRGGKNVVHVFRGRRVSSAHDFPICTSPCAVNNDTSLSIILWGSFSGGVSCTVQHLYDKRPSPSPLIYRAMNQASVVIILILNLTSYPSYVRMGSLKWNTEAQLASQTSYTQNPRYLKLP